MTTREGRGEKQWQVRGSRASHRLRGAGGAAAASLSPSQVGAEARGWMWGAELWQPRAAELGTPEAGQQ